MITENNQPVARLVASRVDTPRRRKYRAGTHRLCPGRWGGCSVWDPARIYVILEPNPATAGLRPRQPRSSFHFTADTLWNGLSDSGAVNCNGLIRD